MKTTPFVTSDLSASVLAVPPLARNADLSLNEAANRRLIRHLETGGVTTLMYGGNANFYHVGLYEYARILDYLAETVSPASWVIPAAGPDFGRMMDQAPILKQRSFPTALVLPQAFPATAAGVEAGLARFAEAFGRPVLLYIKSENHLDPESAARLVNARIVSGIKYAIVRDDPRQDPFLSELVQRVDRKCMISGIGERPAVVHWRDFGLNGFTSGSVCVAPRGSMALLAALRRKDYPAAERFRAAYMTLEDCRDALSPIRVLHQAVTLAGIAEMGPMLPLLSNLEAEHHARVGQAARELLAQDQALAARAA